MIARSNLTSSTRSKQSEQGMESIGANKYFDIHESYIKFIFQNLPEKFGVLKLSRFTENDCVFKNVLTDKFPSI